MTLVDKKKEPFLIPFSKTFLLKDVMIPKVAKEVIHGKKSIKDKFDENVLDYGLK